MFNNKKEVFFVWLVILFGIFLRLFKFDFYPIHNNDDSLFHVWAGTSSYKNITKPASLSIFTNNNNALFWYSQYNNTDVVRRFSFRLEQPYFDQPPLAMFFIALPAKIFGFTDFVQVPQILVRLPAIIASIFSLYLTYILAKIIFNRKVAMLSLMVYSFTPYYVFSHRQSYLENFLIPVILLALISLIKYLAKPNKLWFCLILLTSFAAGWIKIVGFGLFLITSFWLLKNRKIKPFFINLLVGIGSFIFYLLYGGLIDWTQFKFILFSQASRGIYLGSFIHILTNPEFYELFSDGMYFLNFIAIFALLLLRWNDHKIRFLSLNFVFWLVFILLTSGINNNSPWYRYPLFPFLSIATGYYLNMFFTYQNIFLLFPILIFGFTGFDLLKISINSNLLRLFFIVILIPYLLKFLFPKFKTINILAKVTTIVVLIFVLLINVLVPLKYLSTKCKISDCLIPEKIVVDYSK